MRYIWTRLGRVSAMLLVNSNVVVAIQELKSLLGLDRLEGRLLQDHYHLSIIRGEGRHSLDRNTEEMAVGLYKEVVRLYDCMVAKTSHIRWANAGQD